MSYIGCEPGTEFGCIWQKYCFQWVGLHQTYMHSLWIADMYISAHNVNSPFVQDKLDCLIGPSEEIGNVEEGRMLSFLSASQRCFQCTDGFLSSVELFYCLMSAISQPWDRSWYERLQMTCLVSSAMLNLNQSISCQFSIHVLSTYPFVQLLKILTWTLICSHLQLHCTRCC